MVLVGTNVPMVGGVAKVTGAANYVPDLVFPRMVYAKALRSPYAHARLLRVDGSKAETFPGVVAVITRDDLEGLNPYFGPVVDDQPVLATDRVRHVGEPVAIVAAETRESAEEGLDLIEVEYEELPAVFDILEAAKPSAPVLHVQEQLAQIFRLPENQVRIIVPLVGGGYGGKTHARIAPALALLAHKARRPVQWVLTREEVFLTGRRYGAVVKIKTGFKRDGALVARKVDIFYDIGAYALNGPVNAKTGCYVSSGPYNVPNRSLTTYSVYTNLPPTGPFRGVGVSHGCWAYESEMDDIARRVGADPLELRLKQLVQEGDLFVTGEKLVSVGITDCLRRVADAIGWQGKKEQQAGRAASGIARGKGLAVTIKSTTTPTTSSANIRLNADGTAILLTSSVEIGQGVLTSLAQELKDGALQVRGVPDKRMTISEIFRAKFGSPVGSMFGGHCFHTQGGLDPKTGKGKAAVFWFFSACGVEVEVDVETGKVRVLRATTAVDVGRAIHPRQCGLQNEGSFLAGMGSAVFEEMVYDNGQPINSNFLEYMLPSLKDHPKDFKSLLVETPHPEGPFGAKGTGEAALPAVAPAIGNAIANALGGVRIRDLPIKPDRIVAALQASKEIRSCRPNIAEKT